MQSKFRFRCSDQLSNFLEENEARYAKSGKRELIAAKALEEKENVEEYGIFKNSKTKRPSKSIKREADNQNGQPAKESVDYVSTFRSLTRIYEN